MPCKFFDSCPHRSGWCNSDYVLMKCNYGLNRLCDERIIKIDTLQKENAELKRLLKLAVEDMKCNQSVCNLCKHSRSACPKYKKNFECFEWRYAD